MADSLREVRRQGWFTCHTNLSTVGAMTDQNKPEEETPKVDQQDGGPGAQQDDGGDTNDVASGGVSSKKDESPKE